METHYAVCVSLFLVLVAGFFIFAVMREFPAGKK